MTEAVLGKVAEGLARDIASIADKKLVSVTYMGVDAQWVCHYDYDEWHSMTVEEREEVARVLYGDMLGPGPYTITAIRVG